MTPENCGDTMRMCYNFLVYTRFGALRMPNSRKKKDLFQFISYLVTSQLPYTWSNLTMETLK